MICVRADAGWEKALFNLALDKMNMINLIIGSWWGDSGE
jgi:hypothetical protein